jgi:tetratricopeptide (TPR) repeat protein
MRHAHSSGRGPRKATAATLASVLALSLSAAPATAQAVTVIGDPGGEACYQAARLDNGSRTGLEACDHALDLNALSRRDRAATHLNRGIIHSARGNLNAAMADYLQAREIRPGMPESYVGEGNVRFLMGEFSAALDAYDMALELGLTSRHAAHFNRGLTFEQMGRWDDAEAAYGEASAIAPNWDSPRAHIERVQQRRAAEAAAQTN